MFIRPLYFFVYAEHVHMKVVTVKILGLRIHFMKCVRRSILLSTYVFLLKIKDFKVKGGK